MSRRNGFSREFLCSRKASRSTYLSDCYCYPQLFPTALCSSVQDFEAEEVLRGEKSGDGVAAVC